MPEWPGAYERGLLGLPKVSPQLIDLRGNYEQNWMVIDAATQEKGAPLNALELSRIDRGKPWRSPRARLALAAARGRVPPFSLEEVLAYERDERSRRRSR